MENIMQIMGEEGDTTIKWDPSRKEETENAERTFKELTEKGYKAFRMDGEEKGRELDRFDKKAGKILFIVPMGGG